MPQKTEPLEHETYYHIYNRGINGETLFREPDNYRHFLRLYDKYIEPVADTFAWCLMPNHFHLLVQIKGEEEIASSNPASGFGTLAGLGIILPGLFQIFSMHTPRHSTNATIATAPFSKNLSAAFISPTKGTFETWFFTFIIIL